MPPITLQGALTSLTTGGSVVLAVLLISWLASNSAKFNALAAGVKQAAMVGASLVLSLGAWAILTYVPPATLTALAAPFGIAALTVTGLLASQAWNANVNKKLAAPTLIVKTVDAQSLNDADVAYLKQPQAPVTVVLPKP